MKLVAVIKNAIALRYTFTKFHKEAKALVDAGIDVVLEIRTLSKTRVQESRYHAMIGEVAAQIGGDLMDEADAKRILISAFRIDTLKDMADEWAKFGELRIGRGLRGETVLLGTQSRNFCMKLASAFIEWLYAFGAENSVEFSR